MNSEIIYRNIWTDKQIDEVRQLSGPILVIGASGFIGANLFHGSIKYAKMCMHVPATLKRAGDLQV